MEYLLIALFVLVITAIILLICVLIKLSSKNDSEALKKETENLKNMILQENRELRKEINGTLSSYNTAVNSTVNQQIALLQNQMKEFELL